MAEWLYKATRARATRTETQNLAFLDQFLARSAYELGNGTKADRVWDVAMGDTLHVYYREKDGKLHTLGSYSVTAPAAGSKRFGPIVEGTALVRIIDPAFETRWCGQDAPYDVDPILGCLVGWHVVHRKGVVAPPSTLDVLQHMPTLIPHHS